MSESKKTSKTEASPEQLYNLDAEKNVLGAIIYGLESALSQAAAKLKQPAAFYKPQNQIIYSAILELYSEGKAALDMVQIGQRLREQGKIKEAGGDLELVNISSSFTSSAFIEEHVAIVQDAWYRRQLVSMGHDLAKAPEDYEGSVIDLLNEQQRKIDSILGGMTSDQVESWQEVQQQVYESVQELTERRKNDELSGISSGLQDIDNHLGGWQPGELAILAARPGMGKTAMAVKFAAAAAAEGKSVGIMQLEMSAVQLAKRVLAEDTDSLHANQLYKHGLEKDKDWESFHEVIERTKNYNLHIVPKPGMSVQQCIAEARMIQKRSGLDLLIVDYLQLMSAGEETKRANREQQISEVSRKLKKLAMDLNIPVIALSQLSRAVETRGGNKRPMLSDLRESGSIEQDADQVLFLYRPEYYGIASDEQGESTLGMCETIIAKHRNGSLGIAKVGFDDNRVKFHNLDQVPPGLERDDQEDRVF